MPAAAGRDRAPAHGTIADVKRVVGLTQTGGQASMADEKTGKKPRDITDAGVWNVYARNLAIGLHNTIVHWSPDVVVLGGSMIVGDPAIDVKKVADYLAETLHLYPELPIIKKAELGDVGGLWGGIC